MASHQPRQVSSAVDEYTPRASAYDAANAGWHATLADDFVDWVKPAPGDAVLDLGCGTGLVTVRMAKAVGAAGAVVGIDVTAAMLDQARRKVEDRRRTAGADVDFASVHLVEADIADPRIVDIDAVKRVTEEHGGFDVVSCCSVLILLDDPPAAVKMWAGMLRPGGRIIVDVATEHHSIQYLATEILGKRVGVTFPFSRAWVQGKESVEKLMRDASLDVDQSFVTRSYLPERTFEKDQVDEVFESEVLKKYGRPYVQSDRVNEARVAWREIWNESLDGDQKFRDGHWLYVCVGRKA